ncbi:MAG TPA: hypothetical protein VK934_01405 [Fimbriimonas sp.]|nr:hypothetical protein [Fimbriimonas sp.]
MPTVVMIVGIALVAVAGVVFFLLSRPEPAAVYKAEDSQPAPMRGGTR